MKQTEFTIEVYAAADIIASDGVTKGDHLSFADELVMDDVFIMTNAARLSSVTLVSTNDALFRKGPVGNAVHIDSCLTFMAPDGGTFEVLVLVELDDGTVADIFALPLTELDFKVEYRLVGIERHTATRRFAQAASGSFARGTRIAMHDGLMRKIETLAPGDMVLTRDAGKQPIKWIGQSTLRATGSFAPVVISKGTLHNENDLVVRPDHRLFIYQREDHLGAGRAEVLIKARHLVNHLTVTRRHGGFIDYFQLVLEDHQIIYAEGIAAESHLIDPRTRHALPDSMKTQDHAHRTHLDYEVKDSLIPADIAASLLRKASAR